MQKGLKELQMLKVGAFTLVHEVYLESLALRLCVSTFARLER